MNVPCVSNQEHVMEDRWYPHARGKKWRRCVVPGCNHFEVKDAS